MDCLVTIEGGPKRRQWCYYTCRYLVKIEKHDIIVEKNKHKCDDSDCDRTWLLFALRMMQIPYYLTKNLVQKSCVSDITSQDDGWFHSDYCVSCAEDYDIYYKKKGTNNEEEVEEKYIHVNNDIFDGNNIIKLLVKIN